MQSVTYGLMNAVNVTLVLWLIPDKGWAVATAAVIGFVIGQCKL